MLFFFGAQPIPGFPHKESWFALVVWILALSYLIGGYWLFKPTSNREYFIPILAGVVFSLSLYALPFVIRINEEPVFKILTSVNLIFFTALGIYLLIKRKSKTSLRPYKGIFIRSLIILIVVGFFAYGHPAYFKPYRFVVMALNKDNKRIVSNVRAYIYLDRSDEARRGDCDSALYYAKKANLEAKIWLGLQPVDDTTHQKGSSVQSFEKDSTIGTDKPTDTVDHKAYQDQIKKIQGTFITLYGAYKCIARKFYDDDEYEKALTYYLKADTALNCCEYDDDLWEVEKAHSLNHIALCYSNLDEYELADNLFVKAMKKYIAVKDTADLTLALFVSNYGNTLSEQNLYGYSNNFLKKSIEILKRDSASDENKEYLISDYHRLISNHLAADSLDKARHYINETLKIVDKSSLQYCLTNIYKGIVEYHLSKFDHAESILSECLNCLKKVHDKLAVNFIEARYHLAMTRIALAKYRQARNDLDSMKEIITGNLDRNNSPYTRYLKASAYFNKITGQYRQSESEYLQAIDLYIKEYGEGNGKLIAVFSGLAELEITLGKFRKAKFHSDSSIALFKYFNTELNNPMTINSLIAAAKVAYLIGDFDVSDSLYHRVLSINSDFELNTSVSSASALNGLGLVMTDRKKYHKADSLFTGSLKLFREIFSDDHPFTAIVYLNLAQLKIHENKLAKARNFLTRSWEINKKFYDENHDIFADIYVSMGDLAEKKRKTEDAKKYYQKALTIYLNKFSDEHYKVAWVKGKKLI